MADGVDADLFHMVTLFHRWSFYHMEEDFIGSEGHKMIVFTDWAVSFCVQACNYYVKVSEERAKYNWKLRRAKASMQTCLSLWRTGYFAGCAGPCFLLSVVTVFSRCSKWGGLPRSVGISSCWKPTIGHSDVIFLWFKNCSGFML